MCILFLKCTDTNTFFIYNVWFYMMNKNNNLYVALCFSDLHKVKVTSELWCHLWEFTMHTQSYNSFGIVHLEKEKFFTSLSPTKQWSYWKWRTQVKAIKPGESFSPAANKWGWYEKGAVQNDPALGLTALTLDNLSLHHAIIMLLTHLLKSESKNASNDRPAESECCAVWLKQWMS